MAGIDDYLKQHPELADKDPAKVAAFVYDTEIKASGASRERFNEYFLGAPPAKSDSFLGAESGDWPITRGAKSLARGTINAIKGDAEFDFPSIADVNREAGAPDIENGQIFNQGAFDTSQAALFGDDEDYAAAFQKQRPDAIRKKDKNGNVYFEFQDGGKTVSAYVNQPGLNGEDIVRLGGKVASFLPAVRGVRAVSGAGIGAKVAAGGAGAAATDVGMQMLAGRDEIDPAQTALTGMVGAGGELIAPALSHAVNAARKTIGAARWARASNELRERMVRRQLANDGFKPEDLAGLNLDEVMELGKGRVLNASAQSPEAALASSEFGFRPTRGQSMPDASFEQRVAKTDQLNSEEFLRSSGGGAGQKLEDNINYNADLVGQNVDGIISSYSGGVAQGSTKNQSAEIVHSALLRARDKSRKGYERRYAEAEQYKGEFADEVMLGLPDRVAKRLQSSNVIIDDLGSPAGSKTRGALVLMKELEQNPQTTVKAVENQRQKINNWISDSTPGTPDHRAMVIVKEEFDDALAQALDANMFTGDPRAVTLLKEARGMYAEHAKKFNTNGKAGRIIKQMLDEDASPVEIGNYIFGATGLSKDGAARVVKHYRRAVGGDSEGWNALRETFLHTITSNRNTDTKGMQAMVSTLKQALHGSGEPVVKALYTKAERAKLQRFVRAMDSITLKGDRAKSSGTAERLARMVSSSAFVDMPGVSWMRDISRSLQASSVLRSPTAAPPLVSPLPVGGASVSAQ